MTQQVLIPLMICMGSAFAQQPVILDLDLENETNYLYDGFDYSKLASDAGVVNVAAGFKTFALSLAVDDVVAVNGKPAKGVFLFKGFGARMNPSPGAGTIQADVNRFAAYDLYIEILQPDGTPIGTLMATGRSRRVSIARYVIPKPPRPRMPWMT